MKNIVLPTVLGMAPGLGMADLAAATDAAGTDAALSLQQIRNATLKLHMGGQVFLVDPMLAAKGAYPGFAGTVNSHLRNPLVDLPLPVEDVIQGVDAVIVTHTHLDHWDDAAQALLPNALPVFVQNTTDEDVLRRQGFTDVRVLDDSAVFHGVRLTRTGGRHGTPAMFAVPQVAEAMGQVMGVVMQAPGAPTVYIAGDTVWSSDVSDVLSRHAPDVIVLNTGDARLLGFEGGIIMGAEDTQRVHALAPKAAVVAVHMDALNHTTVSRGDLRAFLARENITDAVLVPDDGQVLVFGARAE